DSQICNHLTLVRVSALAFSDHAVFLSADGAYLCLDGHVMLMRDLNELFCLLNVLVDRIVGAVEHNGGKSCLYAFQASFIAAVVQVKSYRNCDIHLFEHSVYHSHNSLVTC